MATKVKTLFPPIRGRGGYTAMFRFLDESRGERFFDREYDIAKWGVWPGQFTINRPVSFRGDIVHSDPGSWFDIGGAMRPGDSLLVSVFRHNSRGRHFVKSSRVIEIVSVTPGDGGTTVVEYR